MIIHGPRTSAGLHLGPMAHGHGQFGHHHLSFVLHCLCQRFSHDPLWIRLHWIPELQLCMNSIPLIDSFVLTPTSFPTVYCSVSPLPPNYFPSFLANTYKHGPHTRTQSSISSVQPHPVFISFDIIRKAFLPYCVADWWIKQNHLIFIHLTPPTTAPFPLLSIILI